LKYVEEESGRTNGIIVVRLVSGKNENGVKIAMMEMESPHQPNGQWLPVIVTLLLVKARFK
jgi:hypothetical protein